MSIESTLAYIHKTKWLGSKPGLSRTRTLLEMAGRPDRALKFVHVVGTNGKGSTCACLASVLHHAGYTVGLYTSPYINAFNERMQVDGSMITDAELEQVTDFIRPFADSMTDDPPTEFEMITAVAMEYFRRKHCDIVVLEAGLGGLLDSTNVIDPPECAVFCAIGLDHTAQLGDTVEKIAATKAGILKAGVPAVMYDAPASVTDVIAEQCRKCGGRLYRADFSQLSDIRPSLVGVHFTYGKYRDLFLPLPGLYQPRNAALAIRTVEVLREKGWQISDAALREGLAAVHWQGRFELLGEHPTFILDGAHNPHGMAATVSSLQTYFAGRNIHFIVGVMADKDVKAMMSMLVPLAAHFYTVRPDNPRAMSAESLCELLLSLGAQASAFDSIPDAVRTAMQNAGADGVCAALGSLYFSHDIRTAYAAAGGKPLS